MFESFQTVIFPDTAAAGDNQYIPFQLPDGERVIELAAWGNYPAYKGVHLFAGAPPAASMAAQLAGEVTGDVLMSLSNQVVGSRRLPDNVRGVTVYLEQALTVGLGVLVVMVRLCEVR